MVQEVQQTDGAESDSRASQVEASERLAVRCDELTSRLEKALQATALSNRFLLPFRRLPEIAKAEADAFLDFMKTGEANRVRERGAKRAKKAWESDRCCVWGQRSGNSGGMIRQTKRVRQRTPTRMLSWRGLWQAGRPSS